MSSIKNLLKTTPPDKVNYPATNQAHYCWQRYNEFAYCLRKNDGDNAACKQARQLAHSICPDEWVANWDEQRENGTFLGIQAKAGETPAHH